MRNLQTVKSGNVERKTFARKEVETVNIVRVIRDYNRVRGLLEVDNGFKHGTLTFLNILSQRMKIS